MGYSLESVRAGRSLRVIHKPCGKSSDVCVFFVHGAGGRAGQFKHLIRKLENSVNIVAFDFLGHGESPHIDDCSLYTEEEHLKDLSAIFDKYKERRNVYVCHSYGNIHVFRHLKLLQTNGDLSRIVGVVMIGTGIKAPISLGLTLKLPCFVLEWLRPLARSASNAAMFAPETDPDLIHFENSISDTNRMYTMRTIGRDCSDQDRWDGWLEEGRGALLTEPEPGAIPRVLIMGSEDGCFSRDSAEALKQLFRIPDERFHLVEGAGHIPMLEGGGEEVYRILKDFLSEII